MKPHIPTLLALGLFAVTAQAGATEAFAPTAVPEFIALRPAGGKSGATSKPLPPERVPAVNRHVTRATTLPGGALAIQCDAVENPEFAAYQRRKLHARGTQER